MFFLPLTMFTLSISNIVLLPLFISAFVSQETLTHCSTLNSSWLLCESSSRNYPSIRSHAGSAYNPTPPHLWLISRNSFSSQNVANLPVSHRLRTLDFTSHHLTPSGVDWPNWEHLARQQHWHYTCTVLLPSLKTLLTVWCCFKKNKQHIEVPVILFTPPRPV